MFLGAAHRERVRVVSRVLGALAAIVVVLAVVVEMHPWSPGILSNVSPPITAPSSQPVPIKDHPCPGGPCGPDPIIVTSPTPTPTYEPAGTAARGVLLWGPATIMQTA